MSHWPSTGTCEWDTQLANHHTHKSRVEARGYPGYQVCTKAKCPPFPPRCPNTLSKTEEDAEQGLQHFVASQLSGSMPKGQLLHNAGCWLGPPVRRPHQALPQHHPGRHIWLQYTIQNPQHNPMVLHASTLVTISTSLTAQQDAAAQWYHLLSNFA